MIATETVGCAVEWLFVDDTLAPLTALRNESNGMWSTPESARLLMRTVEAQHAQQLAEVADPAGGGSLADSMAGAAAPLKMMNN